ncbi:DUF3017 domain-containing protein [Sanguibacter antarcticus]|uniref:DUF3017 family protein n=1 Tax=Sanguibacter antarcticus TaxID=372484 RepID=A0A2A9E5F8_9MICO|nr:DUF3017 domain-containing protein [Sanguibacter antarcticus]PFG33886.1 Protein of unknown function (DUF3017) [Sanguibacter antarcticus]
MNATGSVMVDDEGLGRLRESAAQARPSPGPVDEPEEPGVAPEDADGPVAWRPTGVGVDSAQSPRHAPKPVVRRETAMWVVCVGVVGVVLVALVFGARESALALAALLVGGSVARAVIPGPGPIGITVRSRAVDVFMFAALGLMIAVLAQTAPNI